MNKTMIKIKQWKRDPPHNGYSAWVTDQVLFNLTHSKYALCSKYRTRAIITRGLYILNPVFEVQGGFLEKFCF